jgi:GNAT superfamily N-acetyltransferase
LAISDAPEAFGSTLQETAERSVEMWQHVLRPEGNPFFICEVENVIGGLIGGLSPSKNSVAQLVSMWVSPQLRGRRVSDELVEHIITWAVEAGACRITLHCTEGNVFAERLYPRHGFIRTGEIEVRERDNAVEFEMALDLNASSR